RAVLPVVRADLVTGVHTVDASGQLERWNRVVAPTLGAETTTTAARLAATARDVVPAGDWDGDRRQALAVRSANGDVVLHRGADGGGFAASGSRIGTGWQRFDVLAGAGDWVGDGTPGILAYDEGAGAVWLYPGTGDGGFARPIEVG